VRITLNLATRPFVDVGPAKKLLRIGIIALAMVSLAGLGALHFVHSKAQAARAREHSLDSALAKIDSERAGYEAMMAQPKNAEFMTEVDELNELFEEKAFSWTMAMESLETELPGGVQVTQIEPQRGKDGKITLHLRVAGPHNLSDDLVKNLERSRRFHLPRIVGEEAESANTANTKNIEPVSTSNRFNFDLQAEYVPPTEDELAAEKRKFKAVERESITQMPTPSVAPQPAMRNPVLPLHQPPTRGPRPGVGRLMPPDQQGQRAPYTGGPQ